MAVRNEHIEGVASNPSRTVREVSVAWQEVWNTGSVEEPSSITYQGTAVVTARWDAGRSKWVITTNMSWSRDGVGEDRERSALTIRDSLTAASRGLGGWDHNTTKDVASLIYRAFKTPVGAKPCGSGYCPLGGCVC